ncbi:HsdM family class I SAM-dependent methyltransferase [Methylomagnum sp.]
MSSIFHSTDRLPRYSQVSAGKADGATYTPPNLAVFVAERIVENTTLPESGPIHLLDPSVGDGSLLLALIARLPESIQPRLIVTGFDIDPDAVTTATRRLREAFPRVAHRIERRDFLDFILAGTGLFAEQTELFNLVIANPPYVRTQVMGTTQSRALAQRFGLSGRVDLYFPFLLGIAQVLAETGTAGIIVSNRFMTTKAGQAVRRALLERFDLRHVWDLGDTKLFAAAVLPAVLLGTKPHSQSRRNRPVTAFSSLYEERDAAPETWAAEPLAILSQASGSVVGLADGRRFRVKHGVLDHGDTPEGVWRIATDSADAWLDTVTAHTWATFSRIGKIRVGVKSTADKVFIHSDWNAASGGRPPELLQPLTTRHCARRFKPVQPKQAKQILYPYDMTIAGRIPVDLDRYPNSARYLETHRSRLESRTYLIEAGRRWYEIWVPHDPAGWREPKLVFLDIAERPIFWIDQAGAIVNGECYWLRCEVDADPDWLWLALAVANSSFIESFYDHRFNNKLYAGRRRFITQYVEQFPLPDPAKADSRAIIQTAKRIFELTPSPEAERLAGELDWMIWRVFGLEDSRRG